MTIISKTVCVSCGEEFQYTHGDDEFELPEKCDACLARLVIIPATVKETYMWDLSVGKPQRPAGEEF